MLLLSQSQSQLHGRRKLIRPLKLISLVLFVFFIIYQLYCYILLNEESITSPSRKLDSQRLKSSNDRFEAGDDINDEAVEKQQIDRPNAKPDLLIPDLVWSPISTVRNNLQHKNFQMNSFLDSGSLPQHHQQQQYHNYPHPHVHDYSRQNAQRRFNVQQIVGIAPDIAVRYQKAFQFKAGYFRCIYSRDEYIEREYFNDDFCDCSDGTDEPSTSACSAIDYNGQNTRFYCKSSCSLKPGQHKSIFYSQVNDGICDCCDGSDELFISDISKNQHYHKLMTTSIANRGKNPVQNSDLFQCFIAKVQQPQNVPPPPQNSRE